MPLETAPTDLAMVGTGRQGVSKAQSSPHPQSCPRSKRLQEGDQHQIHAVSLRALTDKIGLPTCAEEHHGRDGILGLTQNNVFHPMDGSYLLSGETWQTAAEGW
jgi:hypothetical protein